MEDINLELRGIVLKYSLELEHSVNRIFITFLSIENATSTRNFGNRAGISFQHKIDLLYDLGILSKTDLQAFELLMTFRNRFLHNIVYNSFGRVLEDLDNGIVNKLKKYSVEGNFACEDDYLTSFKHLYIEILDILNVIISNRKEENERKMKLVRDHVQSLYDFKLLVFQYVLDTKTNLLKLKDNGLSLQEFESILDNELNILSEKGKLTDSSIPIFDDEALLKSLLK
ncbi:hypothetical protein [Chryseobacterium sp. 8AT]|uniref:hypothetical protein n=1 Tax=Chryseobacterium sp. 8AT TaxID=2653134 RepID=UPI0012EF8138|nr:hypothetical protein [Chryseobacterium sp. 8AT]VXB03918.1 conserved hypothetical protein [Chryseobacterium sp. 8AT]